MIVIFSLLRYRSKSLDIPFRKEFFCKDSDLARKNRECFSYFAFWHVFLRNRFLLYLLTLLLSLQFDNDDWLSVDGQRIPNKNKQKFWFRSDSDIEEKIFALLNETYCRWSKHPLK